MHIAGFRIRIRVRIRRIRIFSDPGKKVRKWMNKSLFCRVGDVQCKQFHFFCSDFKHPLLRIIWNVKKTKKKSFFPFTPSPLPRIPPGSGSAKRMRIRNPGWGAFNFHSAFLLRVTVPNIPSFAIPLLELPFLHIRKRAFIDKWWIDDGQINAIGRLTPY